MADPADDDGIRFEERGDHAVLTLNRPRKANAMDRRARAAFSGALRRMSKAVRAGLVTAAGPHFCSGIDLRSRSHRSIPHFCSGIDLRERERETAAGDHSAFAEWGDVNVAIRRHPAIFVAAVNGTALGGGLTLVNCCDLAIASSAARFGMPELGFGVYPAMAGPSTQLTVSRKRAAWMMLTTDAIDAREAERYGLVNRVVEPDRLLAEGMALARRIAGFDQAALAASKRALDLIPGSIGDWERAFEYGDLANAAIRARQSA